MVDGSNPLEGFETTQSLLDEKQIGLYPVGTPEPETESLSQFVKATILVATGVDKPGVKEDIEALSELLEGPWPVLPVSSVTGEGFQELARLTFETLDVIRIYTKEPGRPADHKKPFTLKRGATIAVLASTIHKDLSQQFKFAKVWGRSVFDGQKVNADHVLEEGDIVEIHI